METNQIFNLIPNGEDFVKANCPEIYRLLQMRTTLCTRAVCTMNLDNEDENENKNGFEDTTEIQDISFDKVNKTLRVKSVAGFREKKE